jgi:hypothetical protein
VRVWSVETGATLHILVGHTALAHALAFSDDAALLAMCTILYGIEAQPSAIDLQSLRCQGSPGCEL